MASCSGLPERAATATSNSAAARASAWRPRRDRACASPAWRIMSSYRPPEPTFRVARATSSAWAKSPRQAAADAIVASAFRATSGRPASCAIRAASPYPGLGLGLDHSAHADQGGGPTKGYLGGKDEVAAGFG